MGNSRIFETRAPGNTGARRVISGRRTIDLGLILILSHLRAWSPGCLTVFGETEENDSSQRILIWRETFPEPSKTIYCKVWIKQYPYGLFRFRGLDGSPTRIPHPAVATHGRPPFGLFATGSPTGAAGTQRSAISLYFAGTRSRAGIPSADIGEAAAEG